MSIEHEQLYRQYLKDVGVDKGVTTKKLSSDSYVEYINNMCTKIGIAITFENAGSTANVNLILKKVIEVNSILKYWKETYIRNLKTALTHYKNFAIEWTVNND